MPLFIAEAQYSVLQCNIRLKDKNHSSNVTTVSEAAPSLL